MRYICFILIFLYYISNIFAGDDRFLISTSDGKKLKGTLTEQGKIAFQNDFLKFEIPFKDILQIKQITGDQYRLSLKNGDLYTGKISGQALSIISDEKKVTIDLKSIVQMIQFPAVKIAGFSSAWDLSAVNVKNYNYRNEKGKFVIDRIEAENSALEASIVLTKEIYETSDFDMSFTYGWDSKANSRRTQSIELKLYDSKGVLQAQLGHQDIYQNYFGNFQYLIMGKKKRLSTGSDGSKGTNEIRLKTGDEEATLNFISKRGKDALSAFKLGRIEIVFSNIKGSVTDIGELWVEHFEMSGHTNFQKILKGHKQSVKTLAANPEQTLLASGAKDNKIFVWNMADNTLKGILNGHEKAVLDLCFIDSKTLVSASQDKSIRIWDLTTLKEIKSLKGHDASVSSIVYNKQSNSLISAGLDSKIIVWNLKDYSFKLLKSTGGIRSLAFNNNSQQLVSGQLDKAIVLWDLKTMLAIKRFEGHQFSVRSVDISPDGEKLISGSDDLKIKLWDLSSGKSLMTLDGHDSLISQLTFIDKKTCLSVGLDGNIKIWDIDNKTEKENMRVDDPIFSFLLSTDKKKIYLACKSGNIILTALNE